MSRLRSVGGWGEVDLDRRAITTEDDIVDLSEVDRSDHQRNDPAPATQNGATGQDEAGEADSSPAPSSPDRTPRDIPPRDALGWKSDDEFDRWVAHRAPLVGRTPSASTSRTASLADDIQQLPSGGDLGIASAAAGVPTDEPTVPAAIRSRRRLRTSSPLFLPLGRLAHPAAALAALTLTAGGTAIAINADTTGTPHARRQISRSNALLKAAGNNPPADALRATIATVTSELHALARAVPPEHRKSHSPRRSRRHRASRHPRVPVQQHPRAVSEQNTAAQISPAITPAPQTHSYKPPPMSAPSSTSHTSTGSHTSSSQPAGPTRSSPLGGIGSCVSGCT